MGYQLITKVAGVEREILVAVPPSSYADVKRSMSVYFHYATSIVALLLQTAVLATMLRRKLHLEYPAFFSYTCFHVVRTLVLGSMLHFHGSYTAYFWSYWVLDAISLVLISAIIYDMFQKFFRDYSAVRRIASMAFSIGLILLLTIAIAVTAFAPGREDQRIIAAILLLERSFNVVEVGLVMLLSLVAKLMAIPLRGHLCFGIALGFGVESGATLAALALRMGLGPSGNDAISYVVVGSYVVALLIWFLYIFAPQRERELLRDPSSTEAGEWNEALTELLSR